MCSIENYERLQVVCSLIENALEEDKSTEWYENFYSDIYQRLRLLPEGFQRRIEYFCDQNLADFINVGGYWVPSELLLETVLEFRECSDWTELLEVSPEPVNNTELVCTLQKVRMRWLDLKSYLWECFVLEKEEYKDGGVQ